MASFQDKHNKHMIDNALRKIDGIIAEIKSQISTNTSLGYTARYWADQLQNAFIRYADKRIMHQQPNMLDMPCSEKTSGLDFRTSIAGQFDQIHDYLYNINVFSRRIGKVYAQETINREIGLLRAMRSLRLHLDIPYDLHESAA